MARYNRLSPMNCLASIAAYGYCMLLLRQTGGGVIAQTDGGGGGNTTSSSNSEYPSCLGYTQHIQDGYCDADLNNAGCGYDGGERLSWRRTCHALYLRQPCADKFRTFVVLRLWKGRNANSVLVLLACGVVVVTANANDENLNADGCSIFIHLRCEFCFSISPTSRSNVSCDSLLSAPQAR